MTAHTAPSVLRAHAEHQFADELEAIQKADDKPRPPNWKLSPWAGRCTCSAATYRTVRRPRRSMSGRVA